MKVSKRSWTGSLMSCLAEPNLLTIDDGQKKAPGISLVNVIRSHTVYQWRIFYCT